MEKNTNKLAVANTLSLIAIPVIVAAGGWWIQKTIQNQTVNHEYVQLAMTILEEPDTTKAPPELKQFAVDLLNSTSPVPISDVLAKKFVEAKAVVPPQAPAQPTLVQPVTHPTVLLYSANAATLSKAIEALNNAGYIVGGGPPPGKGPELPDVRFYHAQDEATAEQIQTLLESSVGAKLTLNRSRLKDPGAVARHSVGVIEVWLDRPATPQP